MSRSVLNFLQTLVENRVRENKSLELPKLYKALCKSLPTSSHLEALDAVKKFTLYRETYPNDFEDRPYALPFFNTELYATTDVINERLKKNNMPNARCIMSLKDPQIVYISGFLSAEFLEGINPLIDTFMQSEGHTSYLADDGETDLSVRQSNSAWASTAHDDELGKRLKLVEETIPKIVYKNRYGSGYVNEDFQIVDYPIGGKYDAHCDEDNFPQGVTHRISTALFYLKSPAKGGGTSFPVAGLTLTPKAGDLLLFAYGTDNQMVNPYSLHAGDPVLEGQKRIMTLWTSIGRDTP